MTPPTRQGPCSGSKREGSTPGVTAKTSGLLSAGASEKQAENSEKGPGQARARALAWDGAGENLTNSTGRGRSAESLRGGLCCQPGLTGANGVANRRKSFSEQTFPWPPAGITGLGVVHPEADAPHRVERAGCSQTFGTSAQDVIFHGKVL